MKDEMKNETLEEANPEKNPQNNEEDLLYTHKPENRGEAYNGTLLFAEDLDIEIAVENI